MEEVEKNLADVKKKDVHGNTALHIACMLGNEEIARILLEKGAKVRARNNAEWNALDEAIAYGDVELGGIISLIKTHRKPDHRQIDAASTLPTRHFIPSKRHQPFSDAALSQNGTEFPRSVNDLSLPRRGTDPPDVACPEAARPFQVQTVHSIFQAQTKIAMLDTARKFNANLPGMGDFSIDIKWELTTLLPLPSRLRPEDTITVHKKGEKLRVNFSLKEFDITTFKWQRGDMTLLLDIHKDEKAVLLDNIEKKYCVFRTEEVLPQQLLTEKKITKYHLNANQLDFKRAKTLLNHEKTDLKEKARVWFMMCAFLNVCIASFAVFSFCID